MSQIQREINELERAVKQKQASINSLISQYGEGIRPSWVSTDLEIARQYMQNYQADINRLKIKLEEEQQQ